MMPEHPALPDHRPVRDKDAALVQRMFDRVAPRYDVANTLLSLGLDRHWRAVTVAAVDPRPGPVVLDAAGGVLGSGRAPLRATELRPGQQTAFSVELPAHAEVRRYRVTFRAPDGSLVAHADRRTPPSSRASS